MPSCAKLSQYTLRVAGAVYRREAQCSAPCCGTGVERLHTTSSGTPHTRGTLILTEDHVFEKIYEVKPQEESHNIAYL